MATDHQRLLNTARRLLISRADAEDAVQDCYVRALTSFPDRPGLQPAWLHTVLRNIAIDRLRRKQLESKHADAGLPGEEALDSVMEMRSECKSALRQLLSRVSLAEAAAILLCDVFEFSSDEIACIAGKNADASRQFVHRARMRAHRSDSAPEVDEAYVALYLQAVESRDPAPLLDTLRAAIASAQHDANAAPHDRGKRSCSRLVQVNGRYAIALVLDGVVLCLVPVGPQAVVTGELAQL